MSPAPVTPATNRGGAARAVSTPPSATSASAARRAVLFCAAAVLPVLGCAASGPSNHRTWSPDQAVLAWAEFEGEKITVRNIRNCAYLNADEYTIDYYEKTYDLRRLESVDFIVVPFKKTPSLAHTMLSFGFGDGIFLVVSVEVRREIGETFDPVLGMMQQYELIYVVGDERDLIQLRTNHRRDDVYLYRTRCTREQARALFVDIMHRVNQLAEHPEFYDSLRNNCTTNIAQHINHLVPDRIPLDYRMLLPGYSDRLAYDLGLLETDASFEETKRRAHINQAALRHAGKTDFSVLIRR